MGPQGVYWRSTEEDLPPGKEWIKFRLKELRDIGLDMYWYVHGDPTQEFRFLLRQTRRLQEWGPEEVNGTHADHYAMNVNTRQIAAGLRAGNTGLSESSEIYFQALVKYIGTSRPVRVDVWIDDGGRVIRVATTVTRKTLYPDSPIEKGPVDLTQRVVLDYFDYDKYWITPPSRKTIADASVLDER
ncbi:MAG: hypothetical protein M3N24_07030 [Actinomycetota bacterium]|nr:hypothetical protein [Actinomycetota bacterium]